MKPREGNSAYRFFLFLRSSSSNFHPLSSIFYPRFSIFAILLGFLLAGAVVNGACGITPPRSKNQSSDFGLQAGVPSFTLDGSNLLARSDSPAKSDSPPEAAPDLPPPDDLKPDSEQEPKITIDDPVPAKDLPDLPTAPKVKTEAAPDLPPEEKKEPEMQPVSAALHDSDAELELDDTVRDVHRGNTPMRNTWRLLGLKAVLVAALTASPAVAIDPEKPLDKDKQDLAEIKRLLEGINKSLGSLDRLEREIEELRFDRDVRVKSLQAEIIDLKRQVARMKDNLDRVVGPDGSRRTAFSPPTDAAPPLPSGTVRIVSTYPEPAEVIVNDRTFLVQPFQTVVTRIPAGSFTYEVPISGKRANRTLAANDTFKITLFPQ